MSHSKLGASAAANSRVGVGALRSVRDDVANTAVQMEEVGEWIRQGGLDHRICTHGRRPYLYISTGGGQLGIDGEIVKLHAGSFVTAPSSTAWHMSFKPGTEGMWLSIAEAFLHAQVIPTLPGLTNPSSGYWRRYYALANLKHFVGPGNEQIRSDVMNELRAARTRIGMGADPAVLVYIQLILFPRGRFGESRNMEPVSGAQLATRDLLSSFRALIEQNYLRHLQIADYCKLLGVTPRHLTEACRLMTGLTPLAVLHTRLMVEARAKLLYSNASIKEISNELGFEDSSYFCRFFKRQTGQRPADLRQLRSGDSSAQGED